MKDGRLINKNRCNLDIAQAMLSIVSVKACKTRIMYGANLSFVQLEKYLAALLGSGLLEFDNSSYLITERGKEFLELYKNYLERSTRLREEVAKNAQDRVRLENMCFSNKPAANQTENGKDALK